MAWIAKNSAGFQIERREDPFLTAAMRERLDREVLPRYEVKKGALLPVLHEIQHAYGHLPLQALEETAAYLGIAPSEVLDTASFYDEFSLQPWGKVVIGVCQSIACEVCGHGKVLDHLRQRLGIEPGETTADGLVTLRTMECLGACEMAPCALVNEERHDLLTVESIDRILDQVRAKTSEQNGH